jgi:dCTP deaminase
MILSDTRILEEIEKGTIKIVPYDREQLGSNSYDVHLGKDLAR